MNEHQVRKRDLNAAKSAASFSLLGDSAYSSENDGNGTTLDLLVYFFGIDDNKTGFRIAEMVFGAFLLSHLNWDATSFYVPNDDLFEMVKRHSELMVPRASINPNRADAVDELERFGEPGAPMSSCRRQKFEWAKVARRSFIPR